MVQLMPCTTTIEIDQQLGSVPAISAKSEDIQQAFFNVIRNGVQAMGQEGTLEIESVREGDRVAVQIRDTGSGIAPGDLARIYDPFFTTKGPDEGEGLGLFVVQQIVRKYAGTIAFKSNVDCVTSAHIAPPSPVC